MVNPPGNQPSRDHCSSCAPQPVELPKVRAGSSTRSVTAVSFGTPPDDRMSIAASKGEPELSGEEDLAALPPSEMVAMPESDPEMMAMLSRAAERVRLEWKPPPCPEPSRMDDWFLGVAFACSQRPTPVPFFSNVHEELTRSWTALFTARNQPASSSSLSTLDGVAANTEIPPVEWSVTMQLCPSTASTWRGNPSLPSQVCRYSSGLTGSAYAALGTASALHAMVFLQVHQAKALKNLHEGGHDPEVLKELRTVTDLTLRATKVTASSLGRAMSTLVVQEHHLWLCLADMRDDDKVWFLNAPVSQTGLFGDAVESFAQQFLAAQKQTEVIRHILPRRAAAASTPLSPPSILLVAEGGPLRPPPRRSCSSFQQSSTMEWGVGRPPSPSRTPPNLALSGRARGPERGDPEMEGAALWEIVNAPLPPPEEGWVENILFHFVPKFLTKEQFSPSLGPKRAQSSGRAKPGPHSSFSLTSRQQWVVRERHQRPYSRSLCQTVEPYKCCTAHSDPALVCPRAALARSLHSTSLPHCWYIGGSGMELDLVKQTAHLTEERAQLVLNCLNTFKGRTAVPLKHFQRLLGHMAAAAAVTLLGLLHMRPFQHWLHGRVPRWAWQHGTHRVQVTPACRQTFTPWSDLAFLRAGVPLEQVSRHDVVHTGASTTAWGAT